MSTKGINSLTELPTELHRVYDNERDEYWSNNHGKSVWSKIGHAKNAWNKGESVNVLNDGLTRNYNYGKFKDQHRFTIHTFASLGWKLEALQLPMEFM